MKVSQPNDPAEIEADSIADKMMRMPENRILPVNNLTSKKPAIYRKCDTCEEEDTIHRKALPSGGESVSSQSPAHVRKAIGSGGRPLDPKTRSFFEPRLGYDLGSVRIHTGAAAERSAHGLNARAYTLGRNIVFGDKYEPDNESDRHLLAHELVHIAQQAGQSSENVLHRKLKIDTKGKGGAKSEVDLNTAISMIQPLVKAICPDFDVAATGDVTSNAGSDCANSDFAKVAAGKQHLGCCCLCILVSTPEEESWSIVVTTKDAPTTSSEERKVFMTPTTGPNVPEFSYWSASQKVQKQPPAVTFGHELCGHAALMAINAHPPDASGYPDRAYSDIHDPTVRIENALGLEMGAAGDRGLAGSGQHRGESLRVFTVGPYAADAVSPKPFAEQIKAAVSFLRGNKQLMVDVIGFNGPNDTNTSAGKDRAVAVEAKLNMDHAETEEIRTTTKYEGYENLKRVQPATGGGTGAAPVVELRMAFRPAGLEKQIGDIPKGKPTSVGPANFGRVSALKKTGKAGEQCHKLLATTAWKK